MFIDIFILFKRNQASFTVITKLNEQNLYLKLEYEIIEESQQYVKYLKKKIEYEF